MKAIAIMKGNKPFKGNFTFYKRKPLFEPKVPVKKPENVKNFKEYREFFENQYVFGVDMNKKETKKYLSKMNVNVLYFLDEDVEFWKYKNARCQKCVEKCKQSSRSRLENCDNYREK